MMEVLSSSFWRIFRKQNNHPEIARMTAERALGEQRSFLHNRLMLAAQHEPLPAVRL